MAPSWMPPPFSGRGVAEERKIPCSVCCKRLNAGFPIQTSQAQWFWDAMAQGHLTPTTSLTESMAVRDSLKGTADVAWRAGRT